MTSSVADQPDRPPVPLIFAYGFRPFFLLSGLAAPVLLAAWIAVLATGSWPDGAVPAASWHAHEMLFAFVVAAVAGFLLTAVPSWTGTKALSGWPLAGLTALWLAGRVALLPVLGVPLPVAAIIDLAFLPALGVALAGPLVAAGKIRNTAFLALLGLLTTANLLFHLDWLGVLTGGTALGETLAIGVVLMMVAVIGGRIVPAFTRNALRLRGLDGTVVSRPWVEKVTLVSTLLMIPADLALPGTAVAGLLALVAALAHALRLGGWQPAKTLDQPILWVLHLGYAWVPAALALKAAHLLGAGVESSAWVHALTAGAFATMILAVMTRATLGHTGRMLVVTRPTVAGYILLTAAALLRVLAPELPGGLYWTALEGAGAAWIAAFACYLYVYAPILLAPRADGRPG
ncbi:NnrS family protein [Azospirillum brasilense]|uniref:NnrS family protein n=1 Tax=Azospirillum brasilense TaxID=192 RepID=UPI00190DF2C2|nr:NnrS family protein [Azospirillum brasilense]MBK3734722.1 NnrS family protein [Azospirillum brasilense]